MQQMVFYMPRGKNHAFRDRPVKLVNTEKVGKFLEAYPELQRLELASKSLDQLLMPAKSGIELSKGNMVWFKDEQGRWTILFRSTAGPRGIFHMEEAPQQNYMPTIIRAMGYAETRYGQYVDVLDVIDCLNAEGIDRAVVESLLDEMLDFNKNKGTINMSNNPNQNQTEAASNDHIAEDYLSNVETERAEGLVLIGPDDGFTGRKPAVTPADEAVSVEEEEAGFNWKRTGLIVGGVLILGAVAGFGLRALFSKDDDSVLEFSED